MTPMYEKLVNPLWHLNVPPFLSVRRIVYYFLKIRRPLHFHYKKTFIRIGFYTVLCVVAVWRFKVSLNYILFSKESYKNVLELNSSKYEWSRGSCRLYSVWKEQRRTKILLLETVLVNRGRLVPSIKEINIAVGKLGLYLPILIFRANKDIRNHQIHFRDEGFKVQ